MNAIRELVGLLEYLRDRLVVFQLSQEVARAKAAQYDLLSENIVGLRRAIETQQRAADELQAQLAGRDSQIAELRAEYGALEGRQASAQSSSVREERIALFRHLQPIATQLPTLRAAVEVGADLTARDILDLLRPLDQMLGDLGFERIGQAGEETSFDPRLHRAVGTGAGDVRADAPVRVRYVGYQYGNEVVAKAEVTPIRETVSK